MDRSRHVLRRARRRSARLVAITLVLATNAVAPASRAYGSFPGSSGRISFDASLVGGPGDDQAKIYSVNPDGTHLRRLTDYEAFSPAWSPDGTKIAFKTFGIDVMNADGTGQFSLTDREDYDPAWSPDGNTIVFARALVRPDYTTNYELYVIDADGSGLRRLTHDPAFEGEPTWSPDGTRIALQTFRNGNFEIAVIDADGSNFKNITHSSSDEEYPSWSPDGTKLAFDIDRNGDREIYSMIPDGTGLIRLTDNPADDWGPAWSPDGMKIAFSSNRSRSGSLDIWVMDADGANPVNVTGPLTRTIAVEFFPDWQPVP